MNAIKVTFGWPESARRVTRQVVLSVVICVIVPVGSVGALILADDADDVCAPTDDPCRITDVVEIVGGNSTVLDFGTRTVEVTEPGQIKFGTSRGASVQCGNFIVKSGKKAGIKVTNERDALILARRACSGDSAVACLDDDACSAAGAGSCSVGEGRIELNGPRTAVQGSGDWDGASVSLIAAGDIVLGGPIVLNSYPHMYQGYGEAYGGSLEVLSRMGSVTIDAPIEANGNALWWEDRIGGDVYIRASIDVIVNAAVRTLRTVGEISLHAGRDLILEGRLDAADSGGIYLSAGNDIKVGASDTYVAVLAQGLWDGGQIELSAGGDVSLGSRSRLGVTGKIESGGDIIVAAGGDVALNGRISTSGTGYSRYYQVHAVGGHLSVNAGGNLTLGRKSRITALTHPRGAHYRRFPDVDLRAAGNITHEGRISASGGLQASNVSIVAGGDVAISGSIKNKTNGSNNSLVKVEACRLELRDRGKIRSRANGSASADHILTGRERITLFPKSKLIAKPGVNRLIYRDIIDPPEIAGRQYPAVELVVDWLLAGCPVCGNGEIEEGETCDDGNTTDGDGCSSTCQIEP